MSQVKDFSEVRWIRSQKGRMGQVKDVSKVKWIWSWMSMRSDGSGKRWMLNGSSNGCQ